METLNIKRLASQRGWTLGQLAARCRIARPTLSAYNNGQRNPSLSQLLKIAAALGCEVRDLLPANVPRAPLSDDEWLAVHWFRTLSPADKIKALEETNLATLRLGRLRRRTR